MSDEKELIKITQTELDAYRARKTSIDRLNQKLQILREKQIYNALSEGTKVRVDMLKKIQTWISTLEQRIFDPKIIEEMNVKQVIGLLKFTGNLALKLLAQTNDIEKIFKMYIDSSLATKNMEDMSQQPIAPGNSPVNDDKISELKKALIEALTKNIKSSAEEAIISEQTKDGIEIEKLDKLDAQLSDLPELDGIPTDIIPTDDKPV